MGTPAPTIVVMPVQCAPKKSPCPECGRRGRWTRTPSRNVRPLPPWPSPSWRSPTASMPPAAGASPPFASGPRMYRPRPSMTTESVSVCSTAYSRTECASSVPWRRRPRTPALAPSPARNSPATCPSSNRGAGDAGKPPGGPWLVSDRFMAKLPVGGAGTHPAQCLRPRRPSSRRGPTVEHHSLLKLSPEARSRARPPSSRPSTSSTGAPTRCPAGRDYP